MHDQMDVRDKNKVKYKYRICNNTYVCVIYECKRPTFSYIVFIAVFMANLSV